MHFGEKKEEGKVSKAGTPREWLEVGAAIGKLTNTWAERTDIIAEIGPHITHAPALFRPNQAQMEVNTEIAFGKGAKPQYVEDLTKRINQFDNVRACGLILHEAMHARFTLWDLARAAKELKPSENRALHLLEETRIEGNGVTVFPQNRAFLRASAMELIMDDVKENSLSDTRQAAQLAGLSMGRVDAGVLQASDVIAVRAEVDKFIRPATFKALRDIWLEFQSLTDVDFHNPERRAYPLAREWDRLVQEEAKENGEPEEGEGQGQGQGDGEGEGSGEGEGEDGDSEGQGKSSAQKKMMDALREDAQAAAVDAQSEADAQQKLEEMKASAAKKEAAAKEQQKHRDIASEVFGQGSGPLNAATNSRLIEKRPPTTDERRAAITLGRAFERAKYHDRIKTEVTSYLPPGKLRTKALVQQAAYKAQGQHKIVEPYRATKRRHAEDPDLTIGVMVDISGSMNGAMQPMSAAAWILSEAGRRIQAKVGMVYFGNDVFPTLKPGQHLTEVNVYSASDGVEFFNKGFQALDGQLELLKSSGARILVIASDGCYGGTGEAAACEKWLKKCQAAGVGVLWLGFGGSSYAKAFCAGVPDAVFIPVGSSVPDAALRIGEAAVTALQKASARANGS